MNHCVLVSCHAVDFNIVDYNWFLYEMFQKGNTSNCTLQRNSPQLNDDAKINERINEVIDVDVK